MAIDRISEAIAHFIGEFTLTDPEDRLRDQTEAFRHEADDSVAFLPDITVNLLLRAPYDAAGHEAGLTPFWFSALPQANLPVIPFLASVDTPAVQLSFYAPDPLHQGIDVRVAAPPQTYTLGPPPPSSIVVVTHQINILSDNDLLWSDQSTDFVPLIHYETQLADLVNAARSLSPAGIGDLLTVATDAQGFFGSITADYAELAETAPSGAVVTVLTGAYVHGTTLNGVSAESGPSLAEILPQYFQVDEAADPDTADHPFFTDATSAQVAAQIFDVDDGHAVNAGANLVINETVLVTRPTDADVIAVMGDVISLSAISQVNLMRDSGACSDTLAPSHAINVATYLLEQSTPAADPVDNDTAYDGLPVAWGVTRIDGDVVCVNWMHQFNLITDHDRAEITFSGEDTYLNIGGNTTLNQVSLLEIGLAYDLIIVGGQMIDMSLIRQTNVLLNEDSVTYDGDWPAAVSSGDNLLFNSATITEIGANSYSALTDAFANAGGALADGAMTISAALTQDALFAGVEYLSVLYISGDLININAIDQTNIVGDADQIAIELAALEDRPEEPDGPVTVTTGSNAVINLATIFDHGLDSEILVGGEVYDDLLLYQANLIGDDDDILDGQISPLTSEAVAFLADDLIVEQDTDASGMIAATNDGTATTDVIQTMLA